MLLDARWNVLGATRLLKPFGATGVQWNPADDRCVAAKLVVDRSRAPMFGHWLLNGELLRLHNPGTDGESL